MLAPVGSPDRRRVHGTGDEDGTGTPVEGDLVDPLAGEFHSATTRDRAKPGGVDRSAIPSEVNVSTADPGSSPRTAA